MQGLRTRVDGIYREAVPRLWIAKHSLSLSRDCATSAGENDLLRLWLRPVENPREAAMSLNAWAATVVELAAQDKAAGNLGGWTDKEIIDRRAKQEASECEHSPEQLREQATAMLGSDPL